MSIFITNSGATPPSAKPWTQEDAIRMCVEIERVCPEYGCHVALTGGSLYKVGPRKDADILFYRIRQWEKIDTIGMWEALARIGFTKKSGGGWVFKAEYNGKPVDCLFPEEQPFYDADGNEITYGEE